MELYKIKAIKNIYLIADEDSKGITNTDTVDMDSTTFKKWNKEGKRDFTLYIRVSKSIPDKDGKKRQYYKKKKYPFENKTFKDALKDIRDIPEKLLAEIKPQIEKKQDEEEKAKKEADLKKANDRLSVENRILNDVWDEFYEEKTNGIGKQWRPSTARGNSIFYNAWIRDDALGHMAISDIKKPDILKMVKSIAKIRALRTAKTTVDILRPMFNWYFDLHEIDRRNPASVEFATLDNARNVVITIEQAKRLYKAIDEYPIEEVKGFFAFMKTGRRQNEILTLRMENVDLKKNTFTILKENNKAKIDMVYVLRPELLEVLPSRRTGYAFASFNNENKPLAEGTIRPHWKKILQNAKLDKDFESIGGLHMHDIRHVIGKVLRDAEVPRENRGLVLGHTDKQYITDRYSVRNPQTANRAYSFFLDLVYGRLPASTLWTDL